MVYDLCMSESALDTDLAASQLRALAHSSTGTPRQNVRALVIRGRSLGLSPAAVRSVLVRSGGLSEPLRSFVDSPRRFHSAARGVNTARRDDEGVVVRARTAAARRMAVHLLSPARPPKGTEKNTSVRVEVASRSALAVVGVSILSTPGWDSALVSRGALAVELGVGRQAATAHLRAAIDAGWLRERQRRPGGSSVMALGRLRGTQEINLGWDLDQVIGSLGDPESSEDDRTADLIRSVAHPAWRYSDDVPGGHYWLSAVALSAGFDPLTLGVSARMLGRWRRSDLAAALAGDEPVAEVLDRAAGESGSAARLAVARARRAAEVEARREALAEHRAEVAIAQKWLDRLAGCGRMPTPSTAGAVRDQWVKKARAALAGAEDREVVRVALARRLRRAGWTTDVAGKVSAAVLGGAG